MFLGVLTVTDQHAHLRERRAGEALVQHELNEASAGLLDRLGGASLQFE